MLKTAQPCQPYQPYHSHAQAYTPAPHASSAARMGKALARAIYTTLRFGLMVVGAVAIAIWTIQGAIA